MKFPLYYQDSGNIFWYGLQHITPIWKVLIGATQKKHLESFLTLHNILEGLPCYEWCTFKLQKFRHNSLEIGYSLPARFANDRSEITQECV